MASQRTSGTTLSAMVMQEDCEAVLRSEVEPVQCERSKGHDGMHSGSLNGSSFEWSDQDETGAFDVLSVSRPSEEEERSSYASMPVSGCVYCAANDVETAFVFVQPRGLPIAVPGRIGLCSTCHRLLRDQDFEAVLMRTRGTAFDDFPDDAVLDLIRASRDAMPS